MSDTNEIDEHLAEPALLPLDAWHRAHGARMVAFAGYHMPIQYEGIIAEHLWTRENAGLFDVSHMGQLMLSGDGAAAALETVVPGEMAALGEGRMRYSLLLAENGGILDDLMVTTTPMGIYVVVNGAVKWEDIGYLRENLPDDITLNHMEDRALLALQGPKAVDALKRVVPGVERLYFMEASSFLWGHTPLWISRSGYTGEDGFEISVPVESAEALATALCDRTEVKPIGLGARDSLRLEAGLPLYGHDLDPAIDPVEGDLTFAINKRRREQGGFAGAERILGALASGSAKKRVGLKIDGKLPAREGAPIFDGATQIGVLTSGGFSPSLGHPIAMGYVTRDFVAPGTAVEIEVRGKRIAARVTTLPFIAHNYHRKGKTA